MIRLCRQRPFLEAILQEANQNRRQEMLEHANADQINAVSEMVLNLLRKRIPVHPITMAKLHPIRQRYTRWGNAETRSRGEENISKNKEVADSGKVFTMCSKHVDVKHQRCPQLSTARLRLRPQTQRHLERIGQVITTSQQKRRRPET